MRKMVAIAGATATAVMVATSTAAEAITIGIGGTNYDISTITGTYTNNQTLLESQPWFSGSTTTSLSLAPAQQVGSTFGFPNLGGFAGPFFAESVSGGFVNGSFTTFFGGSAGRNKLIAAPDETITWAIASEQSSAETIPEPATILGTLAALGVGIKIKRQRSAAS